MARLMNTSIRATVTLTITIQPIFYEVVDFSKIGKPLEDFNNLAWFPIDEAIAKLKRGSHKWGIEQWKETNTITDKS